MLNLMNEHDQKVRQVTGSSVLARLWLIALSLYFLELMGTLNHIIP